MPNHDSTRCGRFLCGTEARPHEFPLRAFLRQRWCREGENGQETCSLRKLAYGYEKNPPTALRRSADEVSMRVPPPCPCLKLTHHEQTLTASPAVCAGVCSWLLCAGSADLLKPSTAVLTPAPMLMKKSPHLPLYRGVSNISSEIPIRTDARFFRGAVLTSLRVSAARPLLLLASPAPTRPFTSGRGRSRHARDL